MEMICPGCKKEFEPESFPYGDSVTCPYCHRTWETDWDEDWDNLYCWITDKEVKAEG